MATETEQAVIYESDFDEIVVLAEQAIDAAAQGIVTVELFELQNIQYRVGQADCDSAEDTLAWAALNNIEQIEERRTALDDAVRSARKSLRDGWRFARR